MKILFLALEPPYPPTSGAPLRNYHLTRQLARAADVEIAALGEPVEGFGGGPPITELTHDRSRWRWLLASLTKPYAAARFQSAGAMEHAARGCWDTVHAETVWMIPPALRAGVPVVVDTHDIDSLQMETLARVEQRRPRTARQARWRWEAGKTRRYERRMVPAADAIAVTSDEEAAYFEAIGARRVVVVPNGVDVVGVEYGRRPSGSRVVFVATYGYLPNIAAAFELTDEILPRIRAEIPDATLCLVGKDPRPDLLARRGPHVEVTGTVPDVLPYLRRARVTVVPLRAGSGTRLKILEAMAAGVPVVSTSFGVAGLDVRPGQHYLLGETPEELAAQATRVIRDDALADALSEQARKLVVGRYDWSIVARPLCEVHLELAGKAGTRSGER